MDTATVRRAYPSDLTDQEWQRLERLLPRPRVRGRPRKVHMREVCNAILYVLHTGCGWRELPPDLPPWYTAYWWFRTLQQDGTLERMVACLRELRSAGTAAALAHPEPALVAR